MFIIALYATDMISIQKFLDTDSYHYYILEILIRETAKLDSIRAAQTVKWIYSRYKSAGGDALATLYLAVRLSPVAVSDASSVSNWVNEFRAELISLPESGIVEAMRTLYEKGVEDDVTYIVSTTANDASKSFTAFTELLNQNLPSYFTHHKKYLIDTCVQRAGDLKEKCRVFYMAANTGKMTTQELQETLKAISQTVSVVKIPESQKEDIIALYDNCKNNGVAPPQRVILAKFNLRISELCKVVNKVFAREEKIAASVSELMQLQLISIDELVPPERYEYLSYIAKIVSVLTLTSEEFSLQSKLFSLDPQEQMQFNAQVLSSACEIANKESGYYESLIMMTIYNLLTRSIDGNTVFEILNRSSISQKALRKCVEKEKTANMLTDYYDSFRAQEYGSFAQFAERLINTVQPKQGGFFSR
jgi:hypothetical protein